MIRQRKEIMDKKFISGVVITLVVAGTLGFYGGMKYQQSRKINLAKGLNNLQNGQPAFGSMMQGGRTAVTGGRNMGQRGGQFVIGEVISKDEKSITIKLPDGGSKIIFYSDKTTVSKTTDGSTTDLETGKTVMVSSSTNTDGSLTAQNIQVRSMSSILPQ